MRKFLLLTLLLALWSCSTTEHSGATGVGNPSQISLSGERGTVIGDTSFTQESTNSTLHAISDSRREYTISSITVNVEYFCWKVNGVNLPADLPEGLIKVGNTLFYEWLQEFDILNPEQSKVDLNLPNTGYQKMIFALSSQNGERETIHVKGTFLNDKGEEIPFYFGLPFDMNITFRKKGKPFYLDSENGNAIDYIFAIDNWFKDVDILESFGIDLSKSTPVTLLAKDFWQNKDKKSLLQLRKNIKHSGVIKITALDGTSFYSQQ